jgi:hypothetical protein
MRSIFHARMELLLRHPYAMSAVRAAKTGEATQAICFFSCFFFLSGFFIQRSRLSIPLFYSTVLVEKINFLLVFF